MGDRLSSGNAAIALLANSIATGAAVVTLDFAFGGISGAHFNPVVSVADAFSGGIARGDIFPCWMAQTAGGIVGTISSHFMFGLPVITLSRHARSGPAQSYGAVVATFGLMVVISVRAA